MTHALTPQQQLQELESEYGAAFIVRVVNAHSELLALARDVTTMGCIEDHSDIKRLARKAIAKAEEKKETV